MYLVCTDFQENINIFLVLEHVLEVDYIDLMKRFMDLDF